MKRILAIGLILAISPSAKTAEPALNCVTGTYTGYRYLFEGEKEAKIRPLWRGKHNTAIRRTEKRILRSHLKTGIRVRKKGTVKPGTLCLIT